MCFKNPQCAQRYEQCYEKCRATFYQGEKARLKEKKAEKPEAK